MSYMDTGIWHKKKEKKRSIWTYLLHYKEMLHGLKLSHLAFFNI